MTYLKRTNHNASQNRIKLFSIGLFIAILITIGIIFPSFYGTILYPITSIFWKGESGATNWFSHMGQIAASKYSLVLENERLNNEIASREAGAVLLDTLQKENADLKLILGREDKHKSILGIVLSGPSISPYDTLIIDVGSNNNISVGDKVYAEGQTIIGDIAEVYSNTSKVSLYSTPGRMTNVLLGSTTIQMQAIGRGGGNFKSSLPVGAGAETGDVVTFPQLRSNVFAIVGRVVPDGTNSIDTIFFKTPVNINQLRFVEVQK